MITTDGIVKVSLAELRNLVLEFFGLYHLLQKQLCEMRVIDLGGHSCKGGLLIVAERLHAFVSKPFHICQVANGVDETEVLDCAKVLVNHV